MDHCRATLFILLVTLRASISLADTFNCPTDDDSVAYPHPDSCKKYYRCTFGTVEELTCPYTLYFDVISRGCTFAQSVQCVEGTEVEKWDRPICPTDGEEVKLVPHQSICAKYYLCLGSNAVEKRCHDDLLFDEVSRKCTFKKEARCHVDLWCPENDQLQDLKFFTDPEDCSRYAVCYNRKLHYQHCAEGLFFSVEKQQCTVPEWSDCKVRDVVCNGLSPVPHPLKCASYYECSGEYPMLRECGKGLYFDGNLRRCEPNTGQCIDGGLTTMDTIPAETTNSPEDTSSSTIGITTTPTKSDEGGVGRLNNEFYLLIITTVIVIANL